MLHKYETHGIILARTPLSEANALLTIITPSLGLVRARAQSVRRSGAKLAAALATHTESELVIVQGREGWRVAGAVLVENWTKRMPELVTRAAAARVCGLLLRLVAGEAHDAALYEIIRGLFEALSTLPDELKEPAELLAVLRILSALGLDAGAIPGAPTDFSPDILTTVEQNHADYISRINNGITASGL